MHQVGLCSWNHPPRLRAGGPSGVGWARRGAGRKGGVLEVSGARACWQDTVVLPAPLRVHDGPSGSSMIRTHAHTRHTHTHTRAHVRAHTHMRTRAQKHAHTSGPDPRARLAPGRARVPELPPQHQQRAAGGAGQGARGGGARQHVGHGDLPGGRGRAGARARMHTCTWVFRVMCICLLGPSPLSHGQHLATHVAHAIAPTRTHTSQHPPTHPPAHDAGAAGERDALPSVRDRHQPGGGVHGPGAGDREQHLAHSLPQAVQARARTPRPRAPSPRLPPRTLCAAATATVQRLGAGRWQRWPTREARCTLTDPLAARL